MRGTRNDTVEASIKYSFLWKDVKIFKLSMNMRCQGQEEFTNWLLQVGNGSLNDINESIQIPSEFIVKDNIVRVIFGTYIDINDEGIYDRVILTSRNEYAQNINDEVIRLINSDERVYKSRILLYLLITMTS